MNVTIQQHFCDRLRLMLPASGVRISLIYRFTGSLVVLKESVKTVRHPRKRGSRQLAAALSSPPRHLGETIRDILREFNRLSYLLPTTAHSWTLVNTLESVLEEVRQVAAGSDLRSEVRGPESAITTINKTQTNELIANKNKKKSSGKGLKRSFVYNCKHSKNQSQSTFYNGDSCSSAKSARDSINSLPSRTKEAVVSMDHLTHSGPHDLLTEQQMSTQNYIANQQLFTHGLMSHHQSQPITQQSLSSSAAPHSLLHTMTHPSSLPLQVAAAGMLTDTYHMHGSDAAAAGATSFGNIYGQLSQPSQHQQQQRHYLDLPHQQDAHSFVHHMAKITSEWSVSLHHMGSITSEWLASLQW